MNKLLLSAAALGAFAVSAPAAAQYGYQPYSQPNAYGYGNVQAGANIESRILQLDQRFQAGLQAGLIDRTEARNIRPQLRQLRQLERQYSLNGITPQERQDLQLRIRSVRQQLRVADGGAGGRYAAWDRDDGYQYGYNQPYGTNQGYNQGYGQQGYYGQGGPYEEVRQVCAGRSGLGGVLGALLGGGDNCLSVGERVSGSLQAVPYQYQGQFRDGSGYYHRYVNGNVVQIDARTGTVVRIYDVN